MKLSRLFQQQKKGLVVIVVATIASFLPIFSARAGCVTFCGRTVTVPGLNNGIPFTQITMSGPEGVCQQGDQCPPPRCVGDGVVPAGLEGAGGARAFCASEVRRADNNLRQGSAWCDTLDRIVGERCIPDAPAPAPVPARNAASQIPAISPTPAPAPARLGDSHRCRYLCVGDQQSRDGGSCVGPEDRSGCIRDCVQVCGGANRCLGVTEGGQPSAASPQHVPQCIPTQRDTSVGGITDSHQFETINEVFASISITAFIGAVVKTLAGFSGALFLLMVLWAGFRWTTSGGDSKGVAAAQTTLRNAVIGIVVVATAYVLVTAVIELIGRATSVAS